MTSADLITRFVDRLADHGVIVMDPTRIVADGRLQRIRVEGDKAGAKTLAYKIHADEHPTGWFEWHRGGISGSFKLYDEQQDLTPEQRKAQAAEWARVKAEREAEQQRLHAERAAYCVHLLGKADLPAAEHPYIKRKGITPQARIRRISRLFSAEFFNDPELSQVNEDVLLVPILDQRNKVCSVQAILADGQKFYCSGGLTRAAWHPIKGERAERVLVCEGYATGAALTAATGYSSACALSANNLRAIVEYVLQAFPGREVVIMGDNDHATTNPPNPGLNKAREAAEAFGVRYLVPAFPPDAGRKETDWDDWLRSYGKAEQLLAMLDADVPHGTVAKANGKHPAPVEGEVLPPAEPEPREVVIAEEILPERYTEDAVADRWSGVYREDFRYVHPWGAWMRWDGQRWVSEKTLAAVDLIRKACREIAQGASLDMSLNASQQRAIKFAMGKAGTVMSIEKLARADRRHAATPDQWDADPMLLNTPAGVVDLRDGSVMPQRRDAYMTKMTNAAPGGACPTWHRFLEVATEGDRELITYMQRLAGYSLTGLTTEQILVFVYGPGGNGKGTFINTLQWVMGGYAQTAPMDMFTERKHEAHSTELADLMGARLVCAQETEEGKRWAEARIKAMTGGDKIKARFMHKDYFEYQPQFKLLFAGNHKPGMRNVDEAMRRRLRLVPFDVVIPPDQRDKGLMEKLRAEAGGILQWAIDGCIDWQRDGLKAPDRVLMATEEYLASQDQLGLWIKDECEVGAGHWHGSRPLYESYRKWCEDSGEYAVAQKRWSQQMQQRGFRARKTKAANVFDGLRLKTAYGVEDAPEWTYGK